MLRLKRSIKHSMLNNEFEQKNRFLGNLKTLSSDFTSRGHKGGDKDE